MPRELCHWNVLERGKEALNVSHIPAYPLVSKALERYPNAAFLGAVAHDAPYYHKLGHSPFGPVAERLHGTEGEDTFHPLASLIARVHRENSEERKLLLTAFLLGMLSHIATDVVFHPVVYYFTGNYHDPDPQEAARSQARHRAFEVSLESWFEVHEPSRRSPLIRDYGEHAETIALFLGSELGTPKEWRESLSTLFTVQGLCRSFFVGGAVRISNTLLLGKLRGVEALVRSGRTRPLDLFESSFAYRNPVTGEEFLTSISRLRDESVKEWLSFVELFSPLFLGASHTQLPPGPSLNSGRVGTRSGEFRFFAGGGVGEFQS